MNAPEWVSDALDWIADRPWHDLIPIWPQGFDDQLRLLTLIVTALFSFDLARILYRRASTIDRLGWSFILFSAAFGVAFASAVLRIFYPGLAFGGWNMRLTTVLVLVIVLWHWGQIRRADQPRVETAMAGTNDHEQGGQA